MDCLSDAHGHDHERGEREHDEEDVDEVGFVDHFVVEVLAEGGARFSQSAHGGVGLELLNDGVLEESRHVEGQHEYEHKDDVLDGSLDGPHARHLVRATHGPVAVTRDQHDEPYRAHVRYRRHDPEVSHVGPCEPEVRAVFGVATSVRQGVRHEHR